MTNSTTTDGDQCRQVSADLARAINAFFEFSERAWIAEYYGQESRASIAGYHNAEKTANKNGTK